MADQHSQANSQSVGALDFSSLILGFSSAALYHMGYQTVEGQSSAQKNFALARQNIDIIRMLREKTKGNLSADEKRLVAEILEDLEKKIDQAQGEK